MTDPIHLGGLVPDAMSGFGRFSKRDGWLPCGAKLPFDDAVLASPSQHGGSPDAAARPVSGLIQGRALGVGAVSATVVPANDCR